MINAFGKEPGLPKQAFWTPGKVLSGAIVAVYVIGALALLGPSDSFEVLVSCAAPILMIWMPEIMGDYTGWGVLHGRPITKPSPVGFVWVFGWITLLLPAVLLIVTWLRLR
jgi:hypothetical protein